MRISHTFFGLLFILLMATACSSSRRARLKSQKDIRCSNNHIKWSVLDKYSANAQVIRDNWKQYFKTDVLSKLSTNTNSIFPIYLDSYGSVYPDTIIFRGISDYFFEYPRIPAKRTYKYSLHQFFTGNKFRNKVKKNAHALPIEEKKFFDTLLSHYDDWSSRKDILEIDAFYAIWDTMMYRKKANQLKQKIAASGATKVLFYVHGYNVPYSLAAIQALELRNFIDTAAGLANQKILVVPIFWPSNNMKYCELPDPGVFEGFNINDKSKFLKGGLRNGWLFRYYANQAFYAAAGLRKIINGIHDTTNRHPPEIVLYSHSLGAVVVTSAIINTFSKMQLNNFVLHHAGINWDSLSKLKPPLLYNKLQACDNLGFEIANHFKKTPFPQQDITLFLSAPAISGENTFINISNEMLDRLNVYSTINTNDPVLSKKNTGIAGKTGIITARKFGASSFGCNYGGDCDKVQKIFEQRNSETRLTTENTLANDHDFFVYFSTPAYRSFVTKMLTPVSTSTHPPAKPVEFSDLFAKLVGLTNENKFNSTRENRFNNRSQLVPIGDFELYTSTQITTRLLAEDLFDSEKKAGNEFTDGLSSETIKKITTKNNPFPLVMLRRELVEDTDPTKSAQLKRKLIALVDKQIAETSYESYPAYTYKTQYQKLVKFVSIRTGNDLFRLGAFTSANNPKRNSWFMQRNDDRDYTGSLLVEIGTDYLRAPRRRNLNSYQTVFYGFDVFTPYFRDTSIFTKNDTFNINDRPHASFQYFGWSKNGLSRRDIYRWTFLIKFGKIGGFDGANFQAALHQDISYSPRPRGWGSQIANKGRLGISIEGTHEWDLKVRQRARDQDFRNVRLQLISGWKVGTYMTNANAGIQISNKSFRQTNPNFMNHRTRQNVICWSDNLMYAVSFVATGVKHNTMLQGYGIFDTKETNDDPLTPRSQHTLPSKLVRPLIFNSSVTISYTSLYFTVFYKWTTYSPETWLDDTGAYREPGDTETMKIGDRWHNFGVVGVCFNIRRY